MMHDSLKPFPAVLDDAALPQTGIASSLSCKVKTEAASEDEEDCEQKSTTVNYSLDSIVIKREFIEVDTAYEYSMEDGVSEMKMPEGEDHDIINTPSDSAVVKSENARSEKTCDTDISEEENLFDEDEVMGKQHEHCGKVSGKSQTFQKHGETDKAGQTCSLCGKVFHDSQTYLRHMWCTHTGEKPYTCKLCGKAFKDLNRLKRHKRSHSNDRPFSCDQCEKTFKTKSNLSVHKLSVHSNKRPHSCDRCGKSFKLNCHLQNHKATFHSNERPFSCDLCGRTFKEQHNVWRHKVAYHSNISPFSCL